MQRWLQILDFSFQEYTDALKRNVKYRVIIDNPAEGINIPENIKALLANPNFKLRLSANPLKTNGAVFDDKEGTFNFYPSKPIGKAFIKWTNHISFLSMFQDQFNVSWKSAIPFLKMTQSNY